MTKSITSKSNPQYRALVALRGRRARKKLGQFLVDGSRDLSRAIACGFVPDAIYVTQASDQDLSDPDLCSVVEWGQRHGVLWELDASLLEQISYGQRRSDVVGVVPPLVQSLDEIEWSENPLIVVLDNVEKPGNVGAVFRSADAVGADAVIMTGRPADRFNPNAIRASAGTVFSIPSAEVECDVLRAFLAIQEIAIALARVDGAIAHWDLPLAKPIALVFGNEATGLGTDWSTDCGQSFLIPMAGIADSLNVSVSASIALFEARRQRFDG